MQRDLSEERYTGDLVVFIKLLWSVLVILFFIPYELIAYLLLFVAIRRCRP